MELNHNSFRIFLCVVQQDYAFLGRRFSLIVPSAKSDTASSWLTIDTEPVRRTRKPKKIQVASCSHTCSVYLKRRSRETRKPRRVENREVEKQNGVETHESTPQPVRSSRRASATKSRPLLLRIVFLAAAAGRRDGRLARRVRAPDLWRGATRGGN